MAAALSQVQDVDYFRTFDPAPSSESVRFLSVVANERGLSVLCSDVAGAIARAKREPEIYMKLLCGCVNISGNFVRH